MSLKEALEKMRKEKESEIEACKDLLESKPDLARAIEICDIIRITQSKPCDSCKGTGKASKELEEFGIISCPRCEGRGTTEDFCPRVILGHNINSNMIKDKEMFGDTKRGDWVAVRSCKEEHGDKTYLGVFLGDLPLNIMVTADKQTHKLEVSTICNPAMYVPDLKDIIFGCGSWWHKMDKPEDLEQITDKDIQDVWYVKALKDLSEEKPCQDQSSGTPSSEESS